MSELDDETLEDLRDPLLRALARTPEVAPFAGTDRYRICSCLGEGGFGVVYEVEDRVQGRHLALKTLKPQRSGSASSIRRLKREFRSAADLVHTNLVGLHELSSDGTRWFFTMDLVRGCDFLEYVRRETTPVSNRPARRHAISLGPRAAGAGLSEARLRGALRQLVAGVWALHQAGIVHRDLKPPNVLVDADGRVVILDFGLADGMLAADPEMSAAGTPDYMAPEQAAGAPPGGAADWYAVGVMLHQALTGAAPVADRDAVPPDAPADLAELCRGLLRADPGERPDAAAILSMLGGAAQPAVHVRAAAAGAFVGRSRELSVLEAAYAAVQAGNPALVRIHGQPGVGKSALIAEFGDELAEDGCAALLLGRCHERESVPFKAFDGVADALVRYLQDLPRNEASGLMPRDIHLVAQLFPVFEGVGSLRDVPARHTRLADPREARMRAFAAIKELVARIADKQPLVIAIDDCQWGDVDSARLLSQLVAPPERPALLLILCYRADEAQHSPTLRETLRMLQAAGDRGQEIALEPLPPRDAEALAASLLGGGTREAARAIAQRGEGHPMFMAELARALRQRDQEERAPPSLMDILWQRVVGLSESARALLETVAVAGQPLPSQLCFEAAGIHGGGVDAMRVLRAEQLVRAGDGGEINVFHDRVRDAVLSRADPGAQRARHLALARSLERAPQCDPEALARHFDAADERELAARHALRAADAAMGALAFDRAAALYRMAIDRGPPPTSADLHEKLGHALLSAGCSAAAGEAYIAGAALADGLRAVDLTRLAAEQMLTVGDVEAGRLALDRALRAVGEELPATARQTRSELMRHSWAVRLRRARFRERAESAIRREQLLHLDVLDSAATGLDTNDPPRSIAMRGRLYRMSLATGEPRRAAIGLMGSVALAVADQPERPAAADRLLDAAVAIGERLDDPRVLGRALLERGKSHFVFGHWLRAAELCRRADVLLAERCAGMANERHYALVIAGTCHARAGQLAAARRLADSLLLDAIERGDPVTEKAVCAGMLGPLGLAADDPAQARADVDRVGMEDRCANVVLRGESAAAIATYEDRPREAIAEWRRRWARIEEMGVLVLAGYRVMTVRSFATALLAGGDAGEVREAAGLARSIRRTRFPFGRAVQASLGALSALREGRPDRAAPLLADAAAWYAAGGMPLDAAACRHRGARISGDHDGAREAVDELSACGVASPERWVAMLLPPVERNRARAGAGR
ncbi:MAG TPA: AAA family ATPase [Kofleriaceae bacterium]|nr:AAA family ATPase [Kofleriaceae bacterium]